MGFDSAVCPQKRLCRRGIRERLADHCQWTHGSLRHNTAFGLSGRVSGRVISSRGFGGGDNRMQGVGKDPGGNGAPIGKEKAARAPGGERLLNVGA